jgi:hypothetical protein
VIISGQLRSDWKMVSSDPCFNPLRRRATLAARIARHIQPANQPAPAAFHSADRVVLRGWAGLREVAVLYGSPGWSRKTILTDCIVVLFPKLAYLIPCFDTPASVCRGVLSTPWKLPGNMAATAKKRRSQLRARSLPTASSRRCRHRRPGGI